MYLGFIRVFVRICNRALKGGSLLGLICFVTLIYLLISPARYERIVVTPTPTKTVLQHSKRIPEECPSLKQHTLTMESPIIDYWQTVSPGEVFVYSAFLDTRTSDISVKTVVITFNERHTKDVFCYLWFQDEDSPLIVSAKRRLIPEQSSIYKASMYMCRLENYTRKDTFPVKVSLTTHKCATPTNLVNIQHNSAETVPKYDFTVCLCGPLKFGFSNTNHLTEWIEMNRLFGAEHFILYNHSASPVLEPYVKHYSDIVEWLQWQLPESITEPFKTMKNFGHLGLVQDCLYRSMYKSRHVVFVDTDELVVPRMKGVDSWKELLRRLDCDHQTFVSVQCVFFKKEWPDDETLSGDEIVYQNELLTQLKTKKEKKIWPHGSRSKYIVRPEKVLITGIHQIWTQLEDTQCLVSSENALLHHYRDWDDPNPNWNIDRYMHQYRDALVDRVSMVHQQIRQEV